MKSKRLFAVFGSRSCLQPFYQQLTFLFKILPDVCKISCKITPLKFSCESHVCHCVLPESALDAALRTTEEYLSGEISIVFLQ